jgi:hypothetical protein
VIIPSGIHMFCIFLMYDKSICAVHFSGEIIQICCNDYEEIDDKCIGEYSICVGEYNICVGEYNMRW